MISNEGERFRVTVDDEYLTALGRATFIFATLEWNAVWCLQSLRPDYVHKLGKRTAGDIAKDLVRAAEEMQPGPVRESLQITAARFKELVEDRNAIIHGKPGTADEGLQRLFRDGGPRTTEDIDRASDEFAACSIALNDVFYTHLRRD